MGGWPTGRFTYLWIAILFLGIAVGYKYVFVTLENTPEKNARLVEQKLQQELNSVLPTVEKLREVIEQADAPSFNSMLVEHKYPYYIFSNRRIEYWSSNIFTPSYRDIIGEFSVSYIEIPKGKYIVYKEEVSKERRNYEIIFLIPLEENTAVVNEYLKNTKNTYLFTDDNIEIRQFPEPDYQEISLENETLFTVKFGNTYANSDRRSSGIIYALLLISLVLLTVFIFKMLGDYTRNRNIALGFVFLLSCILIVRSTMLLASFPFSFVYVDLFDPRHYASSLVNPSLGDLLLNLLCLLLLGMYLFNHLLRSQFVKKVLGNGKITQTIVAASCIFFSFFWLAVHHQTMKTLNFDSQWAMDITQDLDFDYFKVIGFGIFFISVVIYFLFAHVCFRLFMQLTKDDLRQSAIPLITGVFAFVLFAIILRWDFLVVLLANSLFLLIVLYFKLPRYVGKLQYLTFIYIFAFGLPGSVIGLYANFQYNQSSMDFAKSRLANQILFESEIVTAPLIEEASQRIKEDSYIKDRIISPFGSKLIIGNIVRQEYLSNFDKFNIKVYAFNSRGHPFEEFQVEDNDDDIEDIRGRITEYQTEMPGLYFISRSQGQATVRYMKFVEMKDRGQVIGHILIDMTQKRLVPNSVFPLLLSRSVNSQQIWNANQYSYGVFNDGELQYNFGNFNYHKNLGQLSQRADVIFDKSIRVQGYNHRAFEGVEGETVIISAIEPSLGTRFANFSFLFLIYVFSILLFLIVATVYQSLQHIKINYSTKIQLYLNFAFFTPLIIISVTTVSVIVQTFKSSLENQYIEFARNLSSELSGPLSQLRELEIDRYELTDIVYNMSEVADLDVNVFRTNGRLISSSLMQVYQNKVLSNQIDPRAFVKITEEKESAFIQEEKVGLLNYKNVYVGIRSDETGSIIGILSVPFFASQQDLERNIIEVLANIINIFTFVFIIFLFISFFVSRGLTFPLELITQKIKRTTLSSYNEPLSWNSDDEIGMMVTEYNRMLLNLEESKMALAKSEKESAWREMARQVAHEIKNPLTPMQLTLQHMQRVILEGKDNGHQEKRLNQINSLLEQIATLSDIATSFSDFAKMPAPQTERVDLRLLLNETIDLYNKQELGQIIADMETGKFIVEGDRKWLGRAFSNLIINGFQSVNENEEARIEVSLHTYEGKSARVEIKDNGHGIPQHIRDKVFTPNFSTKFTGSGLGLAITRKGIEHASGRIWFESEEGVGTVFYIDIPLGKQLVAE